MGKIGIFFGTNTGTTRLMAKKLAKKLGDVADSPLNVNRISVAQFMQYDAIVLGTPSYGEGRVPSAALGAPNGGWEEFLAQLETQDLSGKTIALYGLGDQVKYKDRFANGLGQLYHFVSERGATVIGQWDASGYAFEASTAIFDGKFCGLVLDQDNQGLLTEERLAAWCDAIVAPLVQAAG